MKKYSNLVCGQVCGTKAQEIYLDSCDSFGWDKSKAKEFGMMKPLYARGAANNGTKTVWLICHSNWYSDIIVTDEKGARYHRNYIHSNLQCIEEYQQDSKFYTDDYPLQDRITFAKNKQGKYVFLGVYRAKEPNSDRHDRTFLRINDIYK